MSGRRKLPPPGFSFKPPEEQVDVYVFNAILNFIYMLNDDTLCFWIDLIMGYILYNIPIHTHVTFKLL